MNKEVTVSVAMCTYRGAQFVGEQLASLAHQTRPPDEIVIVDDASDDETVDLLNDFKSSHGLNVQIHKNKQTQGVAKNFERAISLCNGDIIFLADQDDVWMPEKILEHINVYATAPDCGYIFSDASLVDAHMGSTNQRLWDAIGFNSARHENYMSGFQLPVMLKGGNFVYGTTMSFRAKYKTILLPIESVSRGCTHDVWIACLLSLIGANGVGLNNALVKYRQHANQQAGAGRKKSISKRLHDTLQPRDAFFIEHARDLEAIQKRGELSNLAQSSHLHTLGQCIRHLNARAKIYSTTPTAAIKIIGLELLSGRYRHCSSSWRSVLLDLLLAIRLPKES